VFTQNRNVPARLVPSSGFFEWLPEGKVKKPLYVRLKDAPRWSLPVSGLWGHPLKGTCQEEKAILPQEFLFFFHLTD